MYLKTKILKIELQDTKVFDIKPILDCSTRLTMKDSTSYSLPIRINSRSKITIASILLLSQKNDSVLIKCYVDILKPIIITLASIGIPISLAINEVDFVALICIFILLGLMIFIIIRVTIKNEIEKIMMSVINKH
jgi:hypothetical protein